MKVCNIKAKVTIHSWENKKKKKKKFQSRLIQKEERKEKKKSYIDCIYIL